MMIASEIFCKKWRNGDRKKCFRIVGIVGIFFVRMPVFVKLLSKNICKEIYHENYTK